MSFYINPSLLSFLLSFFLVGLLGYYKGIKTKIVQSVLAAALLFMCKEKITDATRELLAGDDLRKKVT